MRVLIVGNGYAGARAAQVLCGFRGIETVHVSDEPYPAYCRHLLPCLAAGEKTAEDLFLPPSPGSGAAPPVRSGIAVQRIDPGKRSAVLSDGGEVAFDRVLIATGARVFVPETLRRLFGRCGNVIAMRRMKEALALRRVLAQGGRRVVIVGAGRIGVLLAEALKRSRARVFLVDIAHEILPTMLHAEVAARLRPHLEAEGSVTVLAGRSVLDAEAGGETVRALHLSDGTSLPCDAVVLATGVVANTGVLDGGEERFHDGIPVNDRMETPFPGVYAAGDVVRYKTVSGKTEPGQLILNARLQAEAAARNLAGEEAVCPPLLVANVVKIGPVMGAVAGDVDGTGHEDLRVDGGFLRVTFEGEAMTGFQFVGPPDELRGLLPGVLRRFDRVWVRGSLSAAGGFGFSCAVLSGTSAWG